MNDAEAKLARIHKLVEKLEIEMADFKAALKGEKLE